MNLWIQLIHMWQTTANDTQTCLTWNSYPYVANNSTWHTSIFDMKQLSMCGKQQQMTYKHFWHETVVHMWQTTANDTQASLTWNSCPYVANNSKWHQSFLTWNSYPYVTNNSKWHTIIFDETFVHMWQTTANDIQSFSTWNSYHMWQTTANDTQTCLTWNSYPSVANNSKWHRSIFDMKQLSICSKQQQMTHKHVWHETAIHMWQTTANDIQACLTWNSCPYVANNSKWHTIIFGMKHLSICDKQQQMTYNHFWHETVIHRWQTTANDTQSSLTWNSCPYVANNSKWHTNMFAMKQLSICGKQQQMTRKHFWHETVVHV